MRTGPSGLQVEPNSLPLAGYPPPPALGISISTPSKAPYFVSDLRGKLLHLYQAGCKLAFNTSLSGCSLISITEFIRRSVVKYKLIAFVLALTVMSWAQSTTPTQTPAPEQKSAPADAKATCPCCDKMASADHKDAHACMHPKATSADGKDAMSCCAGKDATGAASCCGGKDGKSCSKGDKESAASCGKSGEDHAMACCSGKDDASSAHSCCGGNQCGKPAPHDHTTTGN